MPQIEFCKCRLSSTAIKESLSKQCHHMAFFLPFIELEAFRLILTCFAYMSLHLQGLRKIGLNSKPQQGMASLSRLRTCQSTCSYYIKKPMQHSRRCGLCLYKPYSTTIPSWMWALRMHFVVAVDVVILICEGLVCGVKYEAWSIWW